MCLNVWCMCVYDECVYTCSTIDEYMQVNTCVCTWNSEPDASCLHQLLSNLFIYYSLYYFINYAKFLRFSLLIVKLQESVLVEQIHPQPHLTINMGVSDQNSALQACMTITPQSEPVPLPIYTDKHPYL